MVAGTGSSTLPGPNDSHISQPAQSLAHARHPPSTISHQSTHTRSYESLRLCAPPRSPAPNCVEPSGPLLCYRRNPSRARARTRSHGIEAPSLRSAAHSFAPYPLPGLAPRYSHGSQHALNHANLFLRGSRRSHTDPQLGQDRWHPVPPSASLLGTNLGATDSTHGSGYITTSLIPNVGAEREPGNAVIAERWGNHQDWNAPNEISTSAFVMLLMTLLLRTLSIGT
jgi:hypothetical protein